VSSLPSASGHSQSKVQPRVFGWRGESLHSCVISEQLHSFLIQEGNRGGDSKKNHTETELAKNNSVICVAGILLFLNVIKSGSLYLAFQSLLTNTA
jgi:hypothetical protein